jgi:hypothetical protein
MTASMIYPTTSCISTIASTIYPTTSCISMAADTIYPTTSCISTAASTIYPTASCISTAASMIYQTASCISTAVSTIYPTDGSQLPITFMAADSHGNEGKHGKMRLILNAPRPFAFIRVIRLPLSSSANERRSFTNHRKTSSTYSTWRFNLSALTHRQAPTTTRRPNQ